MYDVNDDYVRNEWRELVVIILLLLALLALESCHR